MRDRYEARGSEPGAAMGIVARVYGLRYYVWDTHRHEKAVTMSFSEHDAGIVARALNEARNAALEEVTRRNAG